ncbi:MAG: tRNA lysidine(34) synthetase TilS [Chitinophagales bacterium]
MIDKIKQYIAQYQLFERNNKLLVACSGGIDSMVLLYLLKILEYDITVAHCNFNLRGEESNADEQFIIDFCTKNNIPFLLSRLILYKRKNKANNQLKSVARKLRYEWFEQLRNENAIDFIVTAHHANDQLETILLNLTKGTGLNGLKGMLPKNNFVVRPLLAITKQEIVAFAHQHKIAFREDSSNASTDYQRNLLRHEVVPVLEKINPNILQNIQQFFRIYAVIRY